MGKTNYARVIVWRLRVQLEWVDFQRTQGQGSFEHIAEDLPLPKLAQMSCEGKPRERVDQERIQDATSL